MMALQSLNAASRSRIAIAVAAVGIGLSVVAPLWFWNGGVIEEEALGFVRNYLADRSVLSKVFDPRLNDLGTYQARELSYFFDLIDAYVLAQVLAANRVVLIPATAVLASLLTIIVFLRGLRQQRSVPTLTGLLLLLMFLSNYVHQVTMGMYYRSAKPLLTPVLMAVAFYLCFLFERRDEPTTQAKQWRRSVLVFTLLCTMSMLDRQGFFYGIVAWAVLTGYGMWSRRGGTLIAAATAAVVTMHLYNVWLGPAIIHALNGYVPDRAYQQVPLQHLVGELWAYRQAAEYLVENVSVLMGSTPAWILWVPLMLLAWAALRRARSPFVWASVLGLLAVSQIAMFAVMIVRYHLVYHYADHRHWYYPLPFQALLLTVIVLLLNRLVGQWRQWQRNVLNLALAAAIAINVGSWAAYRKHAMSAPWFARIHPQNVLLKASLVSGTPSPKLLPAFRDFYDLCVALRRADR